MLSNLVDHVPQLLEYLLSDSLAAVLGTSSALRQKIHNHATKIIDPGHLSDQDIAVLAKGFWPQVTHLSLKCADFLSGANLSHLNRALAVTWTSLLWTDVARASLPRLECLDLSNSNLAGSAIAHLSQGRWLNLESLNLASSNISNSGIHHLGSAHWPLLQTLNHSNNSFDGWAMKPLLCCK